MNANFPTRLLILASFLGTALAAQAEICSLDEDSIPEKCRQFAESCSVMQTCVINENLVNEDIPNARLRDTVFIRIDEAYRSPDHNTVAASPSAPVAVANPDNPLVSASCRRDVEANVKHALARSRDLSVYAASRIVDRHVQKMHDEWSRKGWSNLTPSDVFAHVAECGEVCGPMIAQLSQCHLWAVSESPRKALVAFHVNRYAWPDVYRSFPLELAQLANVALEDPRNRIAIVGRASRDGGALWNMRLSYLRAHTIRSRLLDFGVDREHISLVWLGEQPPQITVPIVNRYGMAELYDSLGDNAELRINRSVMAVVYPGGDSVTPGVR